MGKKNTPFLVGHLLHGVGPQNKYSLTMYFSSHIPMGWPTITARSFAVFAWKEDGTSLSGYLCKMLFSSSQRQWWWKPNRVSSESSMSLLRYCRVAFEVDAVKAEQMKDIHFCAKVHLIIADIKSSAKVRNKIGTIKFYSSFLIK